MNTKTNLPTEMRNKSLKISQHFPHCKKAKIKTSLSVVCIMLFVAFSNPVSLVASGSTLDDKTPPFDIDYTSSVYPGDAVFITLTLDRSISSKEVEQFTAQADLYANGIEDCLFQAQLYGVDKKTFSAVIPLSAWYESGEFYLQVTYQIGSNAASMFDLPITMNKKDFPEEILYLDARNTAIKTDTSPERAVQIDRLNEILSTIDYTAVYQKTAFTFPLDYIYHTGFFGDRRTYEYSDGKSSTSMHYGTDYRAAVGTPVFACGRGKVVMAEVRNSTGFTVVLEHLPGLYSLYYHLDSFSVSVNQIIEQGAQIGESGETGLVTGPHLHWEMRLLGRAVDPEFFTEHYPTH